MYQIWNSLYYLIFGEIFNVSIKFPLKLFDKWGGHGVLILPPIIYVNIHIYMYKSYMYI